MSEDSVQGKTEKTWVKIVVALIGLVGALGGAYIGILKPSQAEPSHPSLLDHSKGHEQADSMSSPISFAVQAGQPLGAQDEHQPNAERFLAGNEKIFGLIRCRIINLSNSVLRANSSDIKYSIDGVDWNLVPVVDLSNKTIYAEGGPFTSKTAVILPDSVLSDLANFPLAPGNPEYRWFALSGPLKMSAKVKWQLPAGDGLTRKDMEATVDKTIDIPIGSITAQGT